jgi:hypothetical protein
MLRHVIPGQLNANREQARGQNDPGNLKRNGSLMRAPVARIEYIGDMWPHEDAESGTKDDFIDVQLREISREVHQHCARS